MSNINTTTFSDVELNIRLAAFSTVVTNGMDNTDRVVVAVSTNGEQHGQMKYRFKDSLIPFGITQLV